MKNLLLLLLFLSLLLPNIAKASGCTANTPFTSTSSCDPNNPDPLTVCVGAGGGLDVPQNTTVFWDFGDGFTTTQSGTSVADFQLCHTYAAPGTYTIYRRIDVNCGTWDLGCKLHIFGSSTSCDYSAQVTVYQSNFASTLSTQIICPDNIGEATFAPSTTDGVSWMWDATPTDIHYNTGDPAIDVLYKPITNPSTSLTFTSNQSGAHNIYYSYGSGCYGVENFNFDLVTLDNINITSDYNGQNVSCYQSTDGEITVQAHGGNQPLTYTWSDGYTETSSSGTSVNSSAHAGDYTVDITDANGCLVQTNITVTEPDELLATAHVTPAICALPPILGDLAIDNITGGTPNYSVLWNTGSNQMQLNGFPSGTYTYTVTDANECTFSEDLVLYNSAEPIANFAVQNECLYDEVNFQDLSSTSIGTITDWSWNFDDGSTSNLQNPSHLYGTSGDYSPSLTVTNSDGCQHTVSNPVTLYPVPTALFSTQNECQYDDVCFTNLSTVGAPDNITSYVYNFGDVSPYSSDENPCHHYNSSGDFNITLIVSTNNGCVDDITLPVTVYPVPVISFSANTICVNEPPTVFTNTSTVGAPDNFQSWLWDFNDGNTSTDFEPTHTYLNAGDYDVQLTGTTNHNCEAAANVTITVYEKPTTTFSSNIVDSCSIACIHFESTSTSETANVIGWQWTFNNGTYSGLEKPTSCFENTSNTDDITFDITLVSTNDLGCSDTLTQQDYITVWHNPIADFDYNHRTIDMYMRDFEFYNQSIGEEFYHWEFGDGNSSNIEFPYHQYADTGTYMVELLVSTIHGCTDTIWKPVRVDAVTNIYAPNTFTPDGDGVNDVFKAVTYNIVELKLMIFDRWGLLLYTGNGVDTFWDGTYKGKESQQDTYIWQIKAKDGFGKNYTYRGHVNLLR